MSLVIGGCRIGQTPPAGTQYTIYVSTYDGNGNDGTPLFITFFTITGDKAAPVDSGATLYPAHDTA